MIDVFIFFGIAFTIAFTFVVCTPRSGIQRIKQDQWTKYKDGKPICGVGHRGYWTNTNTVGGKWPYLEREDGTWYDPETGEDCKVMNLKEILEEYGIKE